MFLQIDGKWNQLATKYLLCNWNIKYGSPTLYPQVVDKSSNSQIRMFYINQICDDISHYFSQWISYNWNKYLRYKSVKFQHFEVQCHDVSLIQVQHDCKIPKYTEPWLNSYFLTVVQFEHGTSRRPNCIGDHNPILYSNSLLSVLC